MSFIFYVYIYLDPRKPGSFDYGELHFDFEPFYVGKGKGAQWLLHLELVKVLRNRSYKLNKIRKIQSLGLEPKIVKYKDNLTEQEAFNLEKKLIKTIGRLDLGQGSLTNLTDGGEGVSGFVFSEETKQKRVEKIKGRTKENDLGRARQAEKMRVIMTGRTKETHSGVASMAEKKKGRTKENHPGVARRSEKMKVIMKGRKKKFIYQ